ncbi:MAG: hypothetical protein COA58_02615 [Bacteroidetes bacterium]|nr:MAG: hypothetical protein COA58_02615 [Bacteroidota bacterium]
MRKTIAILALTVIGIVSSLPVLANDIVDKFVDRIGREQTRIDLLDGNEDQFVRLKSDLQGDQATATYLTDTKEIVDVILADGLLSDAMKIDQLTRVLNILRDVDQKNVHFYTQFKPIIDLITKVQQVKDVNRLNSILKSNVRASLNLMAFYVDKPVAEPFFMAAARSEPSELLKHYKEIDYKPFSVKILDEIARVAPMKIKTYLHSWNAVHQRIKGSENRITNEVYAIYQKKGAATRAFILLNDIYNGKLSIDEAHEIARFDHSLFEYLISMQADESLNGRHSIDDALATQCLKHVRIINDLHEKSDAVRFQSLNKFNASEIYTLMVYSEDEIYTSTFLGMNKRMMAKVDAASTYEFLHHLNFNKFRTFIKMAAGYNTLNSFLGKMGEYEKQKLFAKLVEGIEHANDNLESAVAIADTYGSIRSHSNKLMFEQAILAYYSQIQYTDREAEKLYGLILSVFDLGGQVSSNMALNDQEISLKILPISRIYKEGKNVQQHFFFDDPDGKASYAHFLGMFRNGNWKVLDKGTYIVIVSRSGMAVEIYANKPTSEYAGQDAIKAHFQETGRWPDVVVHRGHSYFASAAIESLTPSAEIVFLGSCGGYNNIAQVLKYSPDAQIISSKQIGTMMVNDRLCLELNEVIRKGNDIIWDDLWAHLDKKFAKGSTASSRFKDYIPPHKNLGALLIKTYRSML